MRLGDARRVVVVDLGFGDAGKGTVTDFLVRALGAAAVVRFNGGAQAGHTVVLSDGRAHTFAQVGAGTFVPGVRTFLSRHVVLHPTALLVELEHLARVGVRDALQRLHVSEACLVTTPLHQAATCVRELARGEGRHGSCGVGVGETMRDALAAPDQALRARDLFDVKRLEAHVLRQQERKRAELSNELRALPDTELARRERAVLEDPAILRAWAERAATLASLDAVRDDAELGEVLKTDRPVLFEGAQGVLLDEWLGFHPYTTWSTCTWQNAEELLHDHASPHPAYRLGVLRAYATRHGAGPFPTESSAVPESPTREHNVEGPWQGRFRSGWFDAVLGRYALAAAGAAHGLAVTHLDQVPRGGAWPYAVAHDLGSEPSPTHFDVAAGSGHARDVRPGPPRDLAHVEAIGKALLAARPVLAQVESERAVATIEEMLDVPVVLESDGPTAEAKRLRG